MANQVVPMDQISMIVQCLKDFKLIEVGSPNWLIQHGQIVSLGQQATLEISRNEDEQVKEELLIYDKITVLLNEVICARVWQQSVLPAILEINPNPKATLLIYAAIFHEGATVALLDMVLYHENACEALNDAAVDLIDYCVLKINELLLTTEEAPEETIEKVEEMSVLSEIKRQQKEISFKISLRCISLLNHMITSKVPLGSLRRVVNNYDVPLLMIGVLKRKPWVRTTHTGGFQKFIDEKWKALDELDALKVDKHEAKIWIFLRQVLFNRELMDLYQITDNRREEFTKCLNMLTECVLDQLPALIDLKEILTQAILSKSFFSIKSPIILDIVPCIFKRLNDELVKHGGSAEIAKRVESLHFSPSDENLYEVAKCLSLFYNSEVMTDLEKITDKKKYSENEEKSQVPEVDVTQRKKNEGKQTCVLQNLCSICKKDTNLKCSLCLSVHYCSKACQNKDWGKHKLNCHRKKMMSVLPHLL